MLLIVCFKICHAVMILELLSSCINGAIAWRVLSKCDTAGIAFRYCLCISSVSLFLLLLLFSGCDHFYACSAMLIPF